MWKDLVPRRRAEILIFAIFTLWLAANIIAPFTLAPASVTNLSGRVGQIDNWSQIQKMNPFAAVVYFIGDANCHQLADRSYYLNGNQMAFCSRDIGIFVGLVLGMGLVLLVDPRVKAWTAALGLVPMAVDGTAQALTSYASNNTLRLLTGALAGVSAALLLHWLALRLLSQRAK